MKKKDPLFLKKKTEYSKLLITKVFPKISVYEKLRIKYLIYFFLGSFLSVSLAFFLIFIASKSFDSDSYSILILLFSVPFILYNFLKKSLANKINKSVMRQLCSVFENFKWKKGTISCDYLYKSALVIPNYHDVQHDDYFYGSYKDVEIVIDEAEYFSITRDYKGREHRSSLFKGIVIHFSFNKKFNSHTVVKNDSIFHKSPSHSLRHTVLEDVVFEKKYDVFTTDEVDARYILTTAFMERLNNLETSFKASRTICSFYDNSLYVSLHTGKDMFSMGSLFKSILDLDQYNVIFDEFYSILRVVDVLGLDKKVAL